MSRIFLSHSSRDSFEAVALRGWLASEGWDDVFLDLDPNRGIAAGERWERSLHAATNRCEAVAFLVSANWLASGWCRKEYELARGLNKKLFAALIDPARTIADLPPELTGVWQVVDLCRGQDLKLFATALPGSHDEKHVAFSQSGLLRLKRGLEKAGLDPKFFAWPPEREPGRAPYRGLKPLEAEDAGVFFGRDAPIVEATDRLRGLGAGAPPRLFVILGASGAGKSSFLRAGLLPRLARDDAHFVVLPPIRPERAALSGESGLVAALAAALPARPRAELRAAAQAGAAALKPALAQLVAAAAARRSPGGETERPPAVVIAVDQAEELFRAEGLEESEALLALLGALAASDDPAVIVLFAIRSDSYDALERAKSLEGMGQVALPLLPMPRGAYAEVIAGPARRLEQAGGKLAIEPRLTERLLADVEAGGGSDALPLLAFTLEQLHLDYGAGGALRLTDYEAFGGLKGAIDAAVQRAFVRADAVSAIPRDRDARLRLLRRGLIPWLAGIDPDSKSPRRNIARRSDIPAEAAPLIDLLVEERLLSSDTRAERDPASGEETRAATIEPTHEALLRQWGLLDGWLKEDFGLLAALEAVKRAASEWDANGRDAAWLAHRGQRLADAGALDARPDIAAKLDAADRAYLATCRAREAAEAAEREQARRNELARAKAETDRAHAEAERAKANARFSRNLTAVFVVAALLLAGVGAWAWKQRDAAVGAAARAEAATKEALAQRNRAESAVAQAIDASNTLVSSMVQKLRNVAGMKISLVEAILEPALKLQDQLIAAGESDPKLRRSQAVALTEAARTQLDVGDTKSALASAGRARDLLRALIAANPNDEEMADDVGAADAMLGDVALTAGRLTLAEEAYQDGRAIRERLSQLKPESPGRRLSLARTCANVGAAQLKRGRFNEAGAAFERSLALAEQVKEHVADPIAARWELAQAYAGLAAVRDARGEIAAEVQSIGMSLDALHELVKSDPSNVLWQRRTAQLDNQLVNAQIRHGDLTSAAQAVAESMAIAQSLLAADPMNVTMQNLLTVSYLRSGDIQKQRMQLAEALRFFSLGEDMRRRIVEADPSNNLTRRDLTYAQDEVGQVQLTLGHASAALQSFTSAFSALQELADSDPEDADWQIDLARASAQLGDAQEKNGQPDEAQKTYEAAMAIVDKLIASDPGNVEFLRFFTYLQFWMAKIETQNGRLDDARQLFQRAADLRQRIVPENSEDLSSQYFMGIEYAGLGDLFTKRSQTDDAIGAYAKALGVMELVVRSSPDCDKWRHFLAFDRLKLSRAYEEGGRPLEAVQSARVAQNMLSALVANHPDISDWGTELQDAEARIARIRLRPTD